MIKKIINELATDSISLSKALTMSKIIASDIGSSSFKTWIKNELEGYNNKTELPDYRHLPCDLVAKEYYLSGYHDRPVDARAFDAKLQKDCGFSMYVMYVVQSITTIEEMISNRNDGEINLSIPPFALEFFKRNSFDARDIYSIVQVAHVSQARNIAIQVKNKLLDTLIELSEQFPDFKSDIFTDPMNKEKADGIVTFNIYGGNPNINTSTGNNNTLNISTNDAADKFFEQLQALGVSTKDAEEAKQIVLQKDAPGFKDKLLGWVGSIANTAVKEGVKIEVGKLIALASGLL